jgi:hypothetical protein
MLERMNTRIFCLAASVLIITLSARVSLVAAADVPAKADAVKTASGGFELVISGEIEPDFAPTVGKLTALYYESYPKLVARFENPRKPAPRHIRLKFERGLKVPAHCVGDVITISIDWLRRYPNDLGLLTHELTHAVQAYPSPNPGWFTEGLADYARALYGPKVQPNWELPPKLDSRQNYTDSYRTTARFLQWLDAKYPGTVDKLHRKIQERAFAVEDFKKLTGKTVEELWAECVRELE